jgi:hypothetical protein
MPTGSASITINKPASEVFAAISDITRTGEWSPECTGGRWLDGATSAAVGARFEGDNVVKVGPIAAKKWTTTSVVTACEPGVVFEFVAAEHSTWRYEFEPVASGTKVTESFDYPKGAGFSEFLYERVLKRSKTMIPAMQKTLTNVKASLER